MIQIARVTSLKGNICTAEFVTTVGCCGGGNRSEVNTACCSNNSRVLSFRANVGQHKELKVGDQVVIKTASYMVWWQALVGLIIPIGLALYFYFSILFPWQLAVLPFPMSWICLGIVRWFFPQVSMPVVAVVNPPTLTPRSQV